MVGFKQLETLNKCLIDWNVNYSVYPYNGYTINEVLMQFFDAINKGIITINEYTNLVSAVMEWVKKEGLKEEVTKALDKLVNDGTIENIINNEIFAELHDNVNDLYNENTKLVKLINSNKDNIFKLNSIGYYNPYNYGYREGEYINPYIEKILAEHGDEIMGIELPSTTIKINKPLRFDRNHLVYGNNTTILVDYPNWEGNDYTAVYLEVNTGVELEHFFEKMNKKIGNFKIKSISPNRGADTTGLKIANRLPGQQDNEFNRSLINAVVDTILVDGFENGVVFSECWNSSILNLSIVNCKKGLQITGQTVNVNFDGLKISNPNKNFEDVNQLTFGVLIPDGTNRECEGITFNNPIIYGCDYNIYVKRGYLVTFNTPISDGANSSAFVVTGGKDINVDNGYLCVIGGTEEKGKKACVEVFDNNRSSDIIFKNTKLVAVNGCLEGVRFSNNFTTDRVIIDKCKFESFIYPLSGSVKACDDLVVRDCKFLNTSGRVFNISYGMANAIIDNNHANNDVYFFDLNENNEVSPTINIGKNFSKTHSTYCLKSVSLKQGGQEFILDNDFYDKNIGLSTLCKIIPGSADLPPYKVLINAQWSKPQIKFDAPLDKNYSVYYECSVVKFDR